MRVKASAGRNRRIFVVDDDTSSAQALAALLLDEGYEAAVTSSSDATVALASGACRLLLLDPSLADGAGLRLLGYAEGLGVPTIVMTSDPSFDPGRSQRGGVGSFMYKPVRLSALLGLIEAASKPGLPS